MVNLRTTSPICIRIVLAFLQFLSCVQCAPGMETERLRSVVQSLKEIFKINQALIDFETPSTSLVSLFSSSRDQTNQHNENSSKPSSSAPPRMPSSSSRGTLFRLGQSLVELFHEFYEAMAKYGIFGFSSFGENCQNRYTHAKIIFKEAIMVLGKAGCQTFDINTFCEALRFLGNKAMHETNFNKAVELYSCAVALCQRNAVYYCNRAAALVKIKKFYEAINDCNKAIEINPKYARAYHRLGSVYYDQGKYLDAMCDGFLKVLQLDPENAPARVNLELAERKLREQLAWLEEQLTFLRKYGTVPDPSSSQPAPQECTVLAFQGPEEGGEGGSEKWVLVEETGKDVNDEDTISFLDFVDQYALSTMPPE